MDEFDNIINEDNLVEFRRLYPSLSPEQMFGAIIASAELGSLDILKYLWSINNPKMMELINDVFNYAIRSKQYETAAWLWNHGTYADEIRIDKDIAETYADQLSTINGVASDSLVAVAEYLAKDDESNTWVILPALKFLAKYDIYPSDTVIKYTIENHRPSILNWLLKYYIASKDVVYYAIQIDNIDALDILNKYRTKIPNDAFEEAIGNDSINAFKWLVRYHRISDKIIEQLKEPGMEAFRDAYNSQINRQ